MNRNVGKLCCAKSCNHRNASGVTSDGRKVRFHKFPEQAEFSKQWAVNTRNPSLASLSHENLRKRVLCSVHFEDASYVRPKERHQSNCSLRWDAVPTIFDVPEEPKEELNDKSGAKSSRRNVGGNRTRERKSRLHATLPDPKGDSTNIKYRLRSRQQPAKLKTSLLLHQGGGGGGGRGRKFKMPPSDETSETEVPFFGEGDIDLDSFKESVKKATNGMLEDKEIEEFFHKCHHDKDDKYLTETGKQEANDMIRPITHPVAALVNVDVQNDFISGSLGLKDCPAGQDGEDIIPILNKLMEHEDKYAVIAYSRDRHPKNHLSFVENVRNGTWELDDSSSIKDPAKVKVGDEVVLKTRFGAYEQLMWPTHCVEGTSGLELHEGLKEVKNKLIVDKGTKSDAECYTAFGAPKYDADTILQDELKKLKVTELYVTGLAYDVCVGNTGLDGLKFGYTVCMVEDAMKGVRFDKMAEMKKRVEEAGGFYTTSKEVLEGKCISVEHRVDTFRRRLSCITTAEQVKTRL